MKKFLLSTFSLCLFNFGMAQTVLFVNDNNLNSDNTDTLLIALGETAYSNFDFYDIATEGANPDANLLEGYDVVIWYTSTDGTNLNFWFDTGTGDEDLKTYLNAGGRLWVIGQDLLYAIYPADTTFQSGQFVYDYMGIESYNVQSYADDGSIGVAQLDLAGGPNYFQNTLTWIFPTAWYVDGVTPRAEAISFYEMGPSSYVLEGETSMLHYLRVAAISSNVLTTLFEPALIASNDDIIEFMSDGIFYLLNFDSGLESKKVVDFTLQPNPASEVLLVQSEKLANENYTILSINGNELITGKLGTLNTTVDVSKLAQGYYFMRIGEQSMKFSKL